MSEIKNWNDSSIANDPDPEGNGTKLCAFQPDGKLVNLNLSQAQGSFGANDQIPVTNSSGDNWDYSEQLKFDGSNLLTSGLQINSAYSFPASDGTAGQVLATDGAGAVDWETVGSPSFGTDGQIPIINGAGDDFVYTNSLRYGGGVFSVAGSSTGVIDIESGSSNSAILRFSNNITGNLASVEYNSALSQMQFKVNAIQAATIDTSANWNFQSKRLNAIGAYSLTNSNLIISSGAITPIYAFHTVTGENNLNDDLDFIDDTNSVDGDILIIQPTFTDITVTNAAVISATANIRTANGSNVVLNKRTTTGVNQKVMILVYAGGAWSQVGGVV